MCILYTNSFGRNTNSRIAVNVQALFLIAEYHTNFTKFLVVYVTHTRGKTHTGYDRELNHYVFPH